jgi:hypothetical protein
MEKNWRKLFKGIIFTIIILTFNPIHQIKAQTYAEVDYLVTNMLYDFLINYERTVSAEVFSKSEFQTYYYNDFVEVYNDLSPNQPDYVPFSVYLNELDSLKWKNPEIEFFHYNLEFIKHSKGFYFDIVHIRLLKEIVKNVFPRHIDSTNLLSAHLLDFTLIFNKFSDENQFQILKIEKAASSMLPDAWHRKSIPDELRVSFGPSFAFFDKIENQFLSNTAANGFSGRINLSNRFAGGKNYAAYWNIGAGIDYFNSTWMLGYDSVSIENQIDNFGDSYTRKVTARDIEQDLNFLYVNLPVGLSLRLFNPAGFSLTFSGELIPRYLLSSDYSTTSGKITYSGTYTEIVDGNPYSFHLTDIGSTERNDYDYFSQPARNRTNEINLEKFGFALGFSVQAGYKVGKHFDVFIAPSWRWGISGLLKETTDQQYLSVDKWEVNPVIGKEQSLSVSNTSIEAGIIFRLNNVVKPFVKETQFKNTERRDQKVNFEDYLVKQIPFNPEKIVREKENIFHKMVSDKSFNRIKRTMDIDYEKVNRVPAPRVNFAFSKTSGIEKDRMSSGRNTIRSPYKGIFLFKPFGFELAKPENDNKFGVYDKLLIDSLNAETVKIKMSYLPALNVSIMMKMNDSPTLTREKIINTFKSKYRDENEVCGLYFYETHGSKISQIVQHAKTNNLCRPCRDTDDFLNDLEKKTGDGSKPIFHFMNEIRLLMLNDFITERRTINLDLYIGSHTALVEAFAGLQNIAEANQRIFDHWIHEADPESIRRELEEIRSVLRRNPLNITQFNKITFFIDYDSQFERSLKNIYYKPREAWQKEEFIRNTHKELYRYINSGGTANKSIRLRNFEFNKM